MQLSITGPRRGNYARSAFKCAATAFPFSAIGLLLWCGLQNGHGYGTGASDIGAEILRCTQDDNEERQDDSSVMDELSTERGRGQGTRTGQAPSLLYTSLASAAIAFDQGANDA